MSKQVGIFLVLILLLAAGALRAEEAGAAGVETRTVIKLTGTHRDRNSATGVSPISEAGLRWIELDVYAAVGEKADMALEFGSGLGIYRDPISGIGAPGRGGPAEMGPLGVRRVELSFDISSAVRFRLGTFMPGWGTFQDLRTTQWRIIDLPLIYTSPAFHDLGWQNTGLALSLAPLEPLEISLFWVNGYFPAGLANADPPLPSGAMDREKAMGGRVRVRFGQISAFAAYYREGWAEDLRGGPATEHYTAQAWILGTEFSSPKYWLLSEWTNLIIDDYQQKTAGEWTDLQSLGGHITAGWTFLADWEALLRWEWMDPNTANSPKTFQRSRFDQTTRWTIGVNYRLAPEVLLMVNFVIPLEEGHRVDVDKGRWGGKYQSVENNYFRFQIQVGD